MPSTRILTIRLPTAFSKRIMDSTAHGLTFTLGRGTELCVEALQLPVTLCDRPHRVVDCRRLQRFQPESHRRYPVPVAWSREGRNSPCHRCADQCLLGSLRAVKGMPLWQLLAEMEAEEITAAVDFRYISDVLTRGEAIALLRERRAGMESRLENLKAQGYPAYTTSVGWFGFSDEKIPDCVTKRWSKAGPISSSR